MATLILTVPDEMAQTIAALPDANRAAYLADINDFATATLATVASHTEYNETNEPVDMAFVAELHDAFAEAERVGTIAFEEVLRLVEADNGPDVVERARARIAAGQTLGSRV